MYRLLLRDTRCEHESEEFDGETAIDTFLLYDRPTTQRNKAADWIKFTFLVDWTLL